MNTLEQIIEAYPDDVFLKADGFDEAVIGLDVNSSRLVYSVEKCIKILMSENEMTEEDAEEFFYYNVSGSHVGELTPIWVKSNFI
jgi:hypothetical protein